MKKILITLAIIILLPLKFSFAQDNIGFVSLGSDDGFKIKAGVGMPIWGPVKAYTAITAGKYALVEVWPGATKKFGKVTGGVLFGPTFDMEKTDTTAATTYFPLIAGVIGAYDLWEKGGVHGFAKYRFALDGAPIDGYDFGIGLFGRF